MDSSRVVIALALAAAASLAQAQALDSPPAALQAGRFEQAIGELDEQISAGRGAQRIAPLYWRGLANGALGMRPGAILDLEAALKGADLAKSPAPVRAQIELGLGTQLLLAGATDRARPHIERAQKDAQGTPLAAAAHEGMAQLLRREGKLEEAERADREALDLAERAGAQSIAAAAATNLFAARIADVEAPSLAGRAVRAAQALPDSHDKAYRLIALAQLATASPNPRRDAMLGDAYQWLAQAAAMGERIGDARALSHASGELGKLYEEAGRDEEALSLTQRAVLAAQQANAPEALYRWQWRAARLQAKLGRGDAALAGYRRAVATLATIRQDLMTELRANRQSYRDTVGPVFVEMADLLLRRASTAAPGNARQQLLIEARDSIESLKAVELEDYFQDECVALLQAKQKALDEIAPRTAVLYPVILPDRVEMLLTLPSGLQRVVLPVSGPDLGTEAYEMRRLLEKRSTHQYLPHARRLYDWLIRPLEQQLAAEQVETMVIVPDGALRQVPLGALHDGERFLVERYALATAPALRLIEPRALQRQQPRVLLNGLTLAVQQFPPLPYVAGEVRSIREMLPGTRVLTDKEFLVGSVEKELRNVNYSIVHIASHGQFDSDPKKSFLLAFDGKLDMDGLERVIKLSRFRDEPVELLTLSACRTAAGDERAALGLAGIAVKAGARSALATLWYINDQASSALVTEFYKQLSEPGASKARALQLAQQALLKDARYRHPGFWSPFLLIGNWL